MSAVVVSNHEALEAIFDGWRSRTRHEVEKGGCFEHLSRVFLSKDKTQASQYVDVQPYSAWAKSQGTDGRDVGVDLVGRLRNEEGYIAIQCKFYAEDGEISKEDIDSFVASSGDFKRRMLIATIPRLSGHAEQQNGALRGG